MSEEMKKPRAPRTENEFGFLTDDGLSHVLTTAKQNGENVEQVITRLQSWRYTDESVKKYIDPTWEQTHPGKHYLQSKRNIEELKMRFSALASAARKRDEDIFADAVDTIRQYNKTLAEFQAQGELLDISPEREPKAEDFIDRFPLLGHSGPRKATQDKKDSVVKSLYGIDLAKLRGLSVIKVK